MSATVECETCRRELEPDDAHDFYDDANKVRARYCDACCPRCHLDDELLAVAESMLGRAQAFADEMRHKGIHVGLGDPARCVTCGEPWPCAVSSQ